MSASQEDAVPAGSEGDASALTPERPWPGLQFFTAADAPYFAGRDREIDDVCRLIRRHAHAVVFGISGLGKTSLLRAGVIPKLQTEGFFPVYVRVNFAPGATSPVEQVRAALAAALRDCGIDAREPAPRESLWEYFHRAGVRFWRGVQMCIPLVIFDQFEEIFTLGREDSARRQLTEALLEELECLIEGRPPPDVSRRFESDHDALEDFDFDRQDFKVVWSLREDFLPDLEGLRGRFHVMGHNRFRLAPLTGEAAMSAILKPGGHLVDQPIAAEIIRRVASLRTGEGTADSANGYALSELRVDPALLSLMCFELNLARLARTPPADHIDADLVRSSSDRILTDFYQRSVAGLPDGVCTFIEDRLLTGQGRFRQSAAEDDFMATPGAAREVLQRLIDGRLLRRDERFGTPTIELSHDVLVAPVREFREQRRQRRQAEEEGRRRLDAEREVERQRRELVRRRLLNRVLAAVSVFLLAALVVAVWQWDRARRARADQVNAIRRAETNELKAKAASREAIGNAELAQKQTSLAQTNALAASNSLALAQVTAIRLTNALAEANSTAIRLTNALAEANSTAIRLTNALAEADVAVRDRSKALFQSHLDAGVTLAHAGDYGSARTSLQLSHGRGTQVSERLRHSRDLMAWFVNLMSATAVQANSDAGAELRGVAVSADARRLAAVGEDGGALVFDLPSGRLLRGWKAHDGIGRAVLLGPDGTWVITAGDDQKVVRWSAETGEWQSEMRAPAAVLALALEGSRLAVGSADGTVALGRLGPELKCEPLPGLVSNLTAVAFAPGGRLLAAASSDGEIRLWELPELTSTRRLEARLLPGIAHDQARLRTLAFNPSGRLLAAGDDDGIIYLRSMPDGATRRTLRGHRNKISGLSFLTNQFGTFLVSAGWDRVLKTWDVNSGQLVRVLDGHSAAVSGLASAGESCFTTGLDKSWREWRPLEGTSSRFLDVRPGRPTAVALAPDASEVAVGFADGLIRAFRLADGQALWRVEAHVGPVTRLAFQADASALLSVGMDGQVRRWDAAGRSLKPDFPSASGPLNAIAIRGAGGQFATAGSGGPVRLMTSPDRLVPESSDGVVSLFTLDSPTPRTFRHHAGEALCVAFGPGANELISAGLDPPEKQVIRWSWKADQPGTTPVNTGLRSRAAWTTASPDGRWIATGGQDGVLSLVRTDGSAAPVLLTGHENTIVRIAFSPDSAQVFTAGTDGTLRAWEIGEELSPAEARELFTLPLPYTKGPAEPLRDFDFLGRDTHGDSWVAVPLTSGYLAIYSLGPIYR